MNNEITNNIVALIILMNCFELVIHYLFEPTTTLKEKGIKMN